MGFLEPRNMKKTAISDFTIKKTDNGWYCTYFSQSCKVSEALITDEDLINRITNNLKPQNRDLLELKRQIKNKAL